MIGDFFTKPLGGLLFITMRDICQGLIPLSELKVGHKYKTETNMESKIKNQDSNVLKERVGNIALNYKNHTNVNSKIEERQELSNGEPNKNKSSGNSFLKTQKCMDKDPFKLQDHEQVNTKCDEDTKGQEEDKSAGKTNFTYRGETVSRNHKTQTTTTNPIKETESKDTGINNNGLNLSTSY